jgi:integrase
MVENVIESKRRAGRSAVYLSDMRIKLGRFKDVFGKRPVATVTPREVEDWLHSLGVAPGSVNSYRRILVVAFNDAKRHGFTDTNPAEKVDQSKEVEGEVGTVTPNEANALLTGADEAILPALAIGLFTGLRAAELERLDWEEVRLDIGHVQVKASKAKSAKNRLVPMSDNLKAWLQPNAKGSGPVWPKGGRKLMEEAHLAAGFGSPSAVAKAKEEGKTLKEWPRNALRHSYATYHLAHHQNAAELALHMGHTSTALIFAHYRLPVTQKHAAIYWGIQPQSTENVIEMDEAKVG